MTHTYAIMEVTTSPFEEIKKKLEDAGYYHAVFHRSGRLILDMNGLAIREELPPPTEEINGFEKSKVRVCDEGLVFCLRQCHSILMGFGAGELMLSRVQFFIDKYAIPPQSTEGNTQ